MKQKQALILIITVIALLATALPAWAAGPVSATLTSDRQDLTVGDPVELTLAVNHPSATHVIIPPLDKIWGDVEVRSQSQTETVDNGDGTQTTRQTITITRFAPGEFETPPLTVTVSDSSGQTSEAVAAPIALNVTPVLAEGDTTLNDIRPPVGLEVPPAWPLFAAGIVLALVVAVAGLWLYRRWRYGRGLVDNQLPHQVALDELARIEGLKLAEQGQFKQHYSLVTDCLRAYLEAQFDIRAFDRTTAELKQRLVASTLTAEHTHKFIGLFTESDLVKFAKLEPDLNMAQQLPSQARTLVLSTRPAPEPVNKNDTPQSFGSGPTQRPAEVTQ
ncbi:MAG: DUF4381 domain-containing protein [Anaerolineae bacterium]|nr:DUF4381 domain-containing protein [Anaerolineae bacterium]